MHSLHYRLLARADARRHQYGAILGLRKEELAPFLDFLGGKLACTLYLQDEWCLQQEQVSHSGKGQSSHLYFPLHLKVVAMVAFHC